MKEERIFHEALSRGSDEREAYLNRECGDDSQLRERLEIMLAAHAEPDGFLEEPSPVLLANINPESHLVGQSIGPYRIRELIGEGGMGLVFAAEQIAPVRRKVAFKIIKTGLTARDTAGRFEVERQALAMMNHAHIARVFDGGTTEDGQPYLVMELVQGPPITQYCDSHHLAFEERLDLFCKLCDAVQHAHLKGVIHRDLKPSNVLVPRIDGTAIPKVIDFGVAKAVAGKLTDATLYTRFAQLIGSPLYMSPEQTELGVVDVDTRSDVYSLGVMLYELLTGGTPLDRETVSKAGFDEMRRLIRDEDPPTPSLRIRSTADGALKTLHAAKNEPRLLRLNDEIDWIVMRAIEKDRARRYQSAAAFAEDIRRLLRNEPIDACPPSRTYLLRKFVRRNRTQVAAALTITLFLFLGVAGLTVSNLAIRQERDRVKSLQMTTAGQKQVAEENLEFAREAVDEWYVRFGEDWIANTPGLTQDQRDLLEKAANFYARISRDASGSSLQLERATVLLKLANVQLKLGRSSAATSAAERAIEIALPLTESKSADLDVFLTLAGCRQVLADVFNDNRDAKNEYLIRRQSLEDLDRVPESMRGDDRFRFAWGKLHRRLSFSAWQNLDYERSQIYGDESLATFNALWAERPDDRDVIAERILTLCDRAATRFERASPGQVDLR